MPDAAKISVVIRTYADTEEVFRLFEILATQSVPPVELIVIDSGSVHDVLERLRCLAREGLSAQDGKRIAFHLIEISHGDFSSAKALNRSIAHASHDLVAILSQDALPLNGRYLEHLAAAFDSDQVAGSYARQVVEGNDCTLWKKDVEITNPKTPRTQSSGDCWFVNTCSMIRRKVWQEHPFDPRAVITEDHEWGKWVQARGYVIKYEPRAVVHHFHDYRDLGQLWERYYDEGRGLAYVHKRRMRLLGAMGSYLRETASDAVWLTRRGKPWRSFHAVVYRAVKFVALYRGFQDGDLEGEGNQ